MIDTDLHDATPVFVLFFVTLGDQRRACEVSPHPVLEDRTESAQTATIGLIFGKLMQ
ncbi:MULTISPECIES: hypothetical protein [unclassified Paraburkholderia]|uniref:hypothetical protein n=1 Tax=unclassified Paraburkholderia TaxID=2615204 RepID=UPI002AB145DA|nr:MULTISPECIES: hypothetical protein [unclassified Paraburkholderia]